MGEMVLAHPVVCFQAADDGLDPASLAEIGRMTAAGVRFGGAVLAGAATAYRPLSGCGAILPPGSPNMEWQISQAHRLGRGEHRGDLDLFPAAACAETST